MKIIAAAALALILPGSAFAQYANPFGVQNNSGNFTSTSAKTSPKVSTAFEVKTFQYLKDALRGAGNDIRIFATAKKHKDAHLAVLQGKLLGETPRHALMFLGLLGCGDSALVGNSNEIGDIYSALINYYTKDRINNQPQISAPGSKPIRVAPASAAEKQQIISAVAMVGNANFNMKQKYGVNTIGQSAVSFLKNIAQNESETFANRRTAVMGLGAIQANAAVDAIAECITKIINNHSRLFDESFVFGKNGLSDNGDGAEALLTAMMLALDTQMDGAAKGRATARMKAYATITGENARATTYASLKGYNGNATTYLAALYLLADRKMLQSNITENWNESHNRILGYSEKSPQSLKMIRVVENKGTPFFAQYECETRRAFLSSYKLYSNWTDSFVYASGTRPPSSPYSFDNCMEQKTQKMVFSIIEFYVLGGLETKATKLAIKVGARALSGYSKAAKAYQIATNVYLKTTSAKDYYTEITKLVKIANK